MIKVSQAVILCGGKGTRLGLLTKYVPKPMIEVCGKPFLEHLIIQLKKNGITNILLLVGYRSNVIKNYFKSGSKFGVKISYSYFPPETNTGSRIFNVKKKLNKIFILLYSDNYSPLNIDKLTKYLNAPKSKILLTLARKKKGNCFLEEKSNSVLYFNKKNEKHKYVEIGYMLIKKDVIKFLNKKTENFSDFLCQMSKKKFVSGLVTKNGYLSIGDKKRLNITQNFFENNQFILIDRDGVLNLINKGDRYLTEPEKLKINSNFLRKLPKKAKYICISNQAGLSTGELKKKKLNLINKKIKKNLQNKSINLIDYFISHHHFKSSSFFRKPNPGMFLKAAKKYKFILDKTFYIGDDVRDIEAAYNANTFAMYIGKKKLNSNQKKKYKFILLNKNILKIFNEKISYKF